MTMRAVLWLALSLSMTTGCASYAQFIETLNTRDLTSCFSYSGQVGDASTRGGRIRGITATGNATIAECQELLIILSEPVTPSQPQ